MGAPIRWKALLEPRKLVFYFFFYGLHIFMFAYGWYKQATDERLAALNLLKWSVWISRGAGLVLSLDTMLIVLPMCRTLLRLVRPKIRWLPLDESIWFHRQVAYSMLFWTIVHTCGHYVNFFNVEATQVRPELALQIHYTQAGGVTGHVMLLCMMLIYTTAHARIRQQSFETFWYTHHLFIPFLLGMYTHATGCFVRDTTDPISPFAGSAFWNHCLGYEGWRWELVGGGLYLIERLYREVRARRDTKIVKIVRHPYEAVEVQFVKPSFKYRAGQWLFLNCPSVSPQQWHPFTITSCPYDPYVSVHMKHVGDWTRDFANAVGAGPAQADFYDGIDPMGIYEVALQAGQEMPPIRVDGPYGAPAEDVFENEIAVLIGTGIGVTPWASVLKNIYHERTRGALKRLRRVEFVWICKDTRAFEWFQALLASMEQLDGAGAFLNIHIYLTQKIDADTANNIVLNSVGTDMDPLTQLKGRTNFGRPDFYKFLGGLRDGITTSQGPEFMPGLESSLKTTVGVYFCGPTVAARDIKKACKESSSSDVNFRFWKEHF
ncbi:nadph oxidase [Diplodia corticola]|uniref:Nadph oxidase n=1 Tax=Diplodia corticola TaxID=236234 RepID=A0A1J9RD60_9PEZI|nr:nadph oxidase [Diplodia corticola]OJD38042.1 nadph oxidase [Diplodia corticola]